jgi:hypothetical protein
MLQRRSSGLSRGNLQFVRKSRTDVESRQHLLSDPAWLQLRSLSRNERCLAALAHQAGPQGSASGLITNIAHDEAAASGPMRLWAYMSRAKDDDDGRAQFPKRVAAVNPLVWYGLIAGLGVWLLVLTLLSHGA